MTAKKAYNPKATKGFKEYMESNLRRYYSPRYRDFEFYQIEYMYFIHYIAEKDKVYSVFIDGVDFSILTRGINLEHNPFGDKGDLDANMTVECVWKMIAAYYRTYGNGMTREQAKERLNMVYIKDKGGTRKAEPAVRISHARLKFETDWRAQRTDVFGRPVHWGPELLDDTHREGDTASFSLSESLTNSCT